MEHFFRFINRIKGGILIVCSLIFNSVDLFALSLPGGDPPCGGVFGPCIPIDGGASFLLAAGVIYGGKKVVDSFKAEK